MPEHDFSHLYAQYPAIIGEMPDIFTSHQFILRLARRHQRLYIEALHAYRNELYGGEPAPFMMVHSILARQLSNFPELIGRLPDTNSHDIFGQQNECAQWRKL